MGVEHPVDAQIFFFILKTQLFCWYATETTQFRIFPKAVLNLTL